MPTYHEIEVAGRTLSIETGKLAQQAHGSAVVRYGDAVVLVTAVMGRAREGGDFFPLTIEYEERLYAVGRIPGSFFRREGRPTTEATLAARLTDRPLRPRFSKRMLNEVQVVITVLSADHENQPDILGIIGASAALSVSQIPFDGPVAATRMGYVDGELVVNPTYEQLAAGKLDLTIAGSRDAVIMIEAGANEVSEEVVLEALRVGQENNVKVIGLQDQIVAEVGRPKTEVVLAEESAPELVSSIESIVRSTLESIIDRGEGRGERNEGIKQAEHDAIQQLSERFDAKDVAKAFDDVLKKTVRAKVIKEGKRPDGRALTEVRPLSSEVGLLPRTHGSALFQRGETQILTVATLGSMSMTQKLDGLSPEDTKRYIHQYNFPPYSTGEVRRMGTGRREIGHGALAERALAPMIPDEAEFPYAFRVVSEAIGSNGSTSMGSVCGSTMALMDAGVPIKRPVSGVAMGLMTDDQGNFQVLTDIQGVEDFFGDMDFKVAGTSEGITALQMDIKVSGITQEIFRQALAQAKEGRAFILNHMLGTLAEPRTELNPNAPRMTRVSIPVDKIGALIGPGGKTIRSIIEATGASVDVENDGVVTIGASDQAAAEHAIRMIEGLTKEVEVGERYAGQVTRLMNFGAFVEILPGKEGLVHVSELDTKRVESVEAAVKVGDELEVMVVEIDRMGRINLSRRAVLENLSPEEVGSRSNGRNGADRGPRDRGGDRRGGDRDRGPRRPREFGRR
ncbi:MAG: polyribonucleotide nucleotidyltransferase [Chloroflexota bacterium]|nr:polyribonucleotide nucleotidyltransferase [Chloroflexota bacterium]MDE2884771.1 polyribonucleotide nucleotidyltransferase [Chloroflexota bacterium]